MKIKLSLDRRLMLIDGRKFARPLSAHSGGCAKCGLLDVWVRASYADQGIMYRSHCDECAGNLCRDGGWKETT
jgi:hypothetical protein